LDGTKKAKVAEGTTVELKRTIIEDARIECSAPPPQKGNQTVAEPQQ